MEKTFGVFIREKREAKGLSRPQLAELAHVHLQTIANVERGTTKIPDLYTIYHLAKSLDIPPDEILPLLPQDIRRQLQIYIRGVGRNMESLQRRLEIPSLLQEFLDSPLCPKNITSNEIERLATISGYEGSKVMTVEAYQQLLQEWRDTPRGRIELALESDKLTDEDLLVAARMLEGLIKQKE